MITIVTDRKTLIVYEKGHAGYGSKGEDIVCAGVSTLLYTYAAMLTKLGAEPKIIDENNRFMITPKKTGKREEAAWESMIEGLHMLASYYEDYLSVAVV